MRHPFSYLLTLLLLLTLTTLALASAPQPAAAADCSNLVGDLQQTRDPESGPLAPGAPFVVTWSLPNNGTCTWSRDYRLIFTGGERMGGPRSLRLREEVPPGLDFYVEMDLTAPDAAGSYTGSWQLRESGGDTFGPALTVAVDVSDDAAATSADDSNVTLPQVLVFGGAGGAGNDLLQCLDKEGKLLDTPTLRVNQDSLQQYRQATLYLCSLSEGAPITVTATNPQGQSFSQQLVQAPAETDFADSADPSISNSDGNEYTGTVQRVDLHWIAQSPAGKWLLRAQSGDFDDQITITVPPAAKYGAGDMGPQVAVWPVGQLDPFHHPSECEYTVKPGQQYMISGAYLSPDAPLQLGIYQNRAGSNYLMKQLAVHTDAQGSFTVKDKALNDPGDYIVIVMTTVNPGRYLDNQTEYMGDGPGSAVSCIIVRPARMPQPHWYLALVSGPPQVGNLEILDLSTGMDQGLYDLVGNCDSRDPAWTAGVWLIFQSNCATDGSGAAKDYDLFASLVNRDDTTIPKEQWLTQLTMTPDRDETEPAAGPQGQIVYRQTPVGTSLDQSGELYLFDPATNSSRSLGIYGRQPTWSPDGTTIALMSNLVNCPSCVGGVQETSWQVYTYDLNTGQASLVSVDCPTQCGYPTWSPDGKQILYQVAVSVDDPTSQGLWLAPLLNTVDGSRKPKRYLAGPYSRPSWSAEGWIAFEGPDGIYRAHVTNLAANPKVERYLYQDPTLVSFRAPAWSR